MSHNGTMPPAVNAAVVNFRLQHGMCPLCATRIYEVAEDDQNRQRLIPMSIEGVVREGRCLFCYPDQTPATSSIKSEMVTFLENSPSGHAPTNGATVATPSTSTSRKVVSRETASTCSSVSESSHAFASTRKRKSCDFFPAERKKSLFIPIPTIRLLPTSPASEAEIAEKPSPKSKKKKTSVSVAKAAHSEKLSNLLFDESSDSENEEVVNKQPTQVAVRDFHGCMFTGTLLSGTVKKGTAELSYTYVDGDEYAGQTSYYKGEIANGMLEGKGYQNDAAGCIYEGSFKRGASNGYGTCRWPTGWIYKGEWVDDLRHGSGTCHQGEEEGGEVYSGEWKADMWHGEGELKFAGGDSYRGEFREDKMQGKGTYTFSDGSIFVGSFKKDFRDGPGKMKYADGQYYEGNWKNNWREGRGKLTYTDGSVFEGTFRADERQDGLLHMPDGIMRSVKGGQVQR
jgi:hypothetical protein